jgi:hypothetical protein
MLIIGSVLDQIGGASRHPVISDFEFESKKRISAHKR